jgi:hypothetical protein
MTEPLDISSEANRTYHYADGVTFTIDAPYKLHVTDTGSHRVVAQDGRTYRPERGWLAISWQPREGAPEFVA